MKELPLLPPTRFVPGKDAIAILSGRQWVCSYSGGKDSTSLVTWIEWLRRAGFVTCASPVLVLSDTGVEYPFLRETSSALMAALSASGWRCETVTPLVHKRLYCSIFGRGLVPVHPSHRKRMRWCTQATKVGPMQDFCRTIGDNVLMLSGVRIGESAVRDEKLLKGCAAGGECGSPDPGEGVYGPIITWKTCKVVEWLGGKVGNAVNGLIPDLLPHMARLLDVYEVTQAPANLYGEVPPPVASMRFGCIGCPAISNEKITKSRQGKLHPAWSHLRRIYGVWDKLYAYPNRCVRIKPDGAARHGPLRMEARKRYFPELLSVQRDAGITLVTAEDEAFIRDCWERKVYPRGWSEADEMTTPPDDTMFRGMP